MKIALDYDETFTRDPKLWALFILNSKLRGHDIRIVTMRPAEGLPEVAHNLRAVHVDIPIIGTSYAQKRTFTNELGWLPDVWVDDTPEYIVEKVDA